MTSLMRKSIVYYWHVVALNRLQQHKLNNYLRFHHERSSLVRTDRLQSREQKCFTNTFVASKALAFTRSFYL